MEHWLSLTEIRFGESAWPRWLYMLLIYCCHCLISFAFFSLGFQLAASSGYFWRHPWTRLARGHSYRWSQHKGLWGRRRWRWRRWRWRWVWWVSFCNHVTYCHVVLFSTERQLQLTLWFTLDQTSDLIGSLYLGVDFYKLKPIIIYGCLGIWNFLRKCSTRYFTGSLGSDRVEHSKRNSLFPSTHVFSAC